MINNLYIKNFAIIDKLNIKFNSGLTVITGETGSGKSILLEALKIYHDSLKHNRDSVNKVYNERV